MRGFIIAFPIGYAPPDDWAARLHIQPGAKPAFTQVEVTGRPNTQSPNHPGVGCFNLWCVVPPQVTATPGAEPVYVDMLMGTVLHLLDFPRGQDVVVVGPFDNPEFNQALAQAILNNAAVRSPAKA